MSLTTEDNFELWWAEYMPDATQDRAWVAYGAARAPEVEAESANRAASHSSPGEGGQGRAPAGWQLESGSGWISIRNLASQCGQDFYKDRDPLIYGFLAALGSTARAQDSGRPAGLTDTEARNLIPFQSVSSDWYMTGFRAAERYYFGTCPSSEARADDLRGAAMASQPPVPPSNP